MTTKSNAKRSFNGTETFEREFASFLNGPMHFQIRGCEEKVISLLWLYEYNYDKGFLLGFLYPLRSLSLVSLISDLLLNSLTNFC